MAEQQLPTRTPDQPTGTVGPDPLAGGGFGHAGGGTSYSDGRVELPTVRDLFAAAALAGLLASRDKRARLDDMCGQAFVAADHMLAARARSAR